MFEGEENDEYKSHGEIRRFIILHLNLIPKSLLF